MNSVWFLNFCHIPLDFWAIFSFLFLKFGSSMCLSTLTISVKVVMGTCLHVHTVVLFLTCLWWRFVQLFWLCMMYILQCSIDTLHVDCEWCILQCSIDTLHVDCGTVLVISSSDSFYCEQILSKSNDFGLVYTILLECIKSAFTLYAWWHRQLRNVGMYLKVCIKHVKLEMQVIIIFC